MERYAETGFQVADHGVNPAETRQIFGMEAINDNWLMNSAHLKQCKEVGGTLLGAFHREANNLFGQKGARAEARRGSRSGDDEW